MLTLINYNVYIKINYNKAVTLQKVQSSLIGELKSITLKTFIIYIFNVICIISVHSISTSMLLIIYWEWFKNVFSWFFKEITLYKIKNNNLFNFILNIYYKILK